MTQVLRERLPYPAKVTTRARLVRVFGYVMKAVSAFKRQADRVPVELLQKEDFSQAIPGGGSGLPVGGRPEEHKHGLHSGLGD